jgi:hypothetical protein
LSDDIPDGNWYPASHDAVQELETNFTKYYIFEENNNNNSKTTTKHDAVQELETKFNKY